MYYIENKKDGRFEMRIQLHLAHLPVGSVHDEYIADYSDKADAFKECYVANMEAAMERGYPRRMFGRPIDE